MTSRAALLPMTPLAAACGGGGGGGSPVGPPPVTEPPGATVTAVVFYDENGNGQLDAGEHGRLPNVEVAIAGRTARTERLTGRATITGVPNGSFPLTVLPNTPPPHYAVGVAGAGGPRGPATIPGVPNGSFPLPVLPNTLPPYYAVGVAHAVTVPVDPAQPA